MGREVILRGGAVKQVVGRVVGVEVWGGVGCIGCTECMGWVHRGSGVGAQGAWGGVRWGVHPPTAHHPPPTTHHPPPNTPIHHYQPTTQPRPTTQVLLTTHPATPPLTPGDLSSLKGMLALTELRLNGCSLITGTVAVWAHGRVDGGS